MVDWVLNTTLFLDGYYLHGLTSLYVHIIVYMYVYIIVPEFSKMQFQDHNVVQDRSFKEFLSFKFKIVFAFLTQKWLSVA